MTRTRVRDLAALMLTVLFVASSYAADPPESGSETAKRRYSEKIEKAEKTLVTGLEKLIEQSETGKQVTAQKLPPEQLLKLSERLKIEKARFLEKGAVPFSIPTIRITSVYINDVAAARADLSAAMNREITKAQKSKDPDGAKALAAELATLMEPTVLATWEYHWFTGRVSTWKLQSDGHIDSGDPPESRPKWSIQNGKVIFKGGEWTDTLEPDLMGSEIRGKNQVGHGKHGKRIDD